MKMNVHDKEWNDLMEMFRRSEIPDHTKGILKLLEMLKDEIEYVYETLKERT